MVGEDARLLRRRLTVPESGFHVLIEPRFDTAAVVTAKCSVHDVFLVLNRTKPRQISLAGLARKNNQGVSGTFLNYGKYAAPATGRSSRSS